MSLWKTILGAFGGGSAATSAQPAGHNAAHPGDSLTQTVTAAREHAYRQHFGELPAGLLKIPALTGHWPGGGIYQFDSAQPDGNYRIHISAGLSNPAAPNRPETEGGGAPGAENGYGYEIMIVTREAADWPLILLKWAIHAEIRHGLGILERIRQYDGITAGDIPIGNGRTANLLIHQAQAPWPAGFDLPNGHIPLLILTTISEAEMNWSLQNSRAALLEQLLATPYRQTSIPERASVVEP